MMDLKQQNVIGPALLNSVKIVENVLTTIWNTQKIFQTETLRKTAVSLHDKVFNQNYITYIQFVKQR